MTVTRQGFEARPDRVFARSIGSERRLCYRCSAPRQKESGKGSRMNSGRPIGVAGAGSIGCFVGGMLAAAGHRVALLARPRVIREIRDHGLRLTSFEGFERDIAPSRLTLSEDPKILADAGVVLVT